MKLSDILNIIKSDLDYVPNSLILKSFDNLGCTYKWLLKSGTYAIRKEIFIAYEESELDLLDKIIINYIEIYPAK